MKNIILFDDKATRENLLPLTFTRPIAELRFGINTIAEKWHRSLPGNYSYLTTDYLQSKFPVSLDKNNDNIFIAGNVCPDKELIDAIENLSVNTAITHNNTLIAFRGSIVDFNNLHWQHETHIKNVPLCINMLYDIFSLNNIALKDDFNAITANRKSQPLSNSNTLIGNPDLIFIEEGAVVEGAILNANKGPIYIGVNAEIMEGSCIRGGFALCEHGIVNMGTRIYGATTIGPYCKVGGELNNVVMQSYSNKAHDGFLGNAVIGEWCNIGGGTSASNLKNDYTEIKLWNYPAHRFLRTGLQFCGLIMGDHSKAGINCMFNTATVVGVGVNIHGSGFPRNFVASFSEGSSAGFTDVSLTKFFDIAKRMMARRNIELTEIDREIFQSIYNIADTYK